MNGKSAETGVLTLTFKGKDVQMSFNPYIIRNNQVSPVNEEEKKIALQYLQEVSTDVEIDDTGKIKTDETKQRIIYFPVIYIKE